MQQKLSENSFYSYTVRMVIQTLQLELREVIKFLGLTRALEKQILRVPNFWSPFMTMESVQYGGFIVVPILQGIQLVYPDRYEDFIHGKYPDVFVDICLKILERFGTINPFLEIILEIKT